MATRKKKAAKKSKVTIKRKRADVRWVTTTQIATSIHAGKHQLALSVSQYPTADTWTVVALETDKDAAGLEAVLASHAHKIIGVYDNLFEAMFAAKTFAENWIPTRDLCDCKEMR